MASTIKRLGERTDVRVTPEVASSHLSQMAAVVLESKGFKRSEAGALSEIEARLEKYISDMVRGAQDFAQVCGRTRADIRDFTELFDMEEDERTRLPAARAELKKPGDPEEEDGYVAVPMGDCWYGTVPEFRKEMRRNRKRSVAGEGLAKTSITRKKVPLSPRPKQMLALSDDDLPGSTSKPSTPKALPAATRPEYMENLDWMPNLPPRHTWKRTYETEEPETAVLKAASAPVTVQPVPQPPAGLANGPDGQPGSAPAPIIAPPLHPPPPPPQVKIRKTTHLTQQSIKYLVGTLSESPNIPLELGVINHRQKPIAQKRKLGEGGRYDIFGEQEKAREAQKMKERKAREAGRNQRIMLKLKAGPAGGS